MELFDKLFKRKKKGGKGLPSLLPKPTPVEIKPERFEVPLPTKRGQPPKPEPAKPESKTRGGLRKIKAELITDIANLTEKDSHLELRREDIEKKINATKDELEKLRKKIVSDSIIDSSVVESIAEHEKARDKLEADMEAVKRKRDHYENDLKGMGERIAKYKTETKAEIQGLTTRKLKVQKEIDALETSIDALNKKIDDLSVKVAFQNSQLEDEKKQRAGVKGEVSTLELTKMYLESQISEQKELIGDLRSQADEMVAKLVQKKRIEGGISTLKGQRTYIEKQIRGLEAKQANLLAGIKELEYKLNGEKSEDSHVQNEVKTLQNKKRLLNEEIQELNEKHDMLIDTLATTKPTKKATKK